MIPPQKFYYFAYGLFLFSIFCILTNSLGGLIVAGFTGVFRELYDRMDPENLPNEIWDMLWTINGGLIGFILVNLSQVLLILNELLIKLL